ncbi:MAG: peptidyl-tRNA hydrolase Pth2 [Candidatus Aenigmarchaeota archaeon]|nr:peptidyl-tRNA hydrolase Pth2 [Candidatus Aenigmarchaeota archaeon]
MKLKQVIIVRKDLKIGKGKLAASVAHASVACVRKTDEKIVENWEKQGAKKVVLKVKNLDELKKIYKKVKKSGLTCFLVKDAGLTQVKTGEIICLGIGPAEEKEIDKITGKLKLL